MAIRILSAADLDRSLTPDAALEAMRTAFGQLSSGAARVPVRGQLESARGATLLMPAFLGESAALGAKIVSVFPRNPSLGEPTVQGAVLLLDAATGRPKALLDGTRLTAIRTAAGSALATELLADPAAEVLTVFGAGAQAKAHIELLWATRQLREIRVLSASGTSAARLAAALRDDGPPPLATSGRGGGRSPVVRACEDPEAALAGAGLVVTATTSRSPLFPGEKLERGAHVNAVGAYRPDMRELDEVALGRARVVVDHREAIWEEAGDLIIPCEAGAWGPEIVDAELGEIVLGRAPAGRGGFEISVFKSVGNAAQDVAMGEAALAGAERLGLGTDAPF